MMTDQINVTENELLDGTKQKLIVVMRNPYDDINNNMSFGDKLADQVALFGGSWAFIILAVCFLAAWALINTIILSHGFDPYPFIFLNLLLSMVAALQAPIIMMSQNRQAEKDRQQAQADFEINCKAESGILSIQTTLETIISDLNGKLDIIANRINENTEETFKLTQTTPRSVTIHMISNDSGIAKISLQKGPLIPTMLTAIQEQPLKY
jgi:uncharacterized membrane protein